MYSFQGYNEHKHQRMLCVKTVYFFTFFLFCKTKICCVRHTIWHLFPPPITVVCFCLAAWGGLYVYGVQPWEIQLKIYISKTWRCVKFPFSFSLNLQENLFVLTFLLYAKHFVSEFLLSKKTWNDSERTKRISKVFWVMKGVNLILYDSAPGLKKENIFGLSSESKECKWCEMEYRMFAWATMLKLQ